MSSKILRWGFFGAGKCTSDFVSAISSSKLHKGIGIASRDLKKAKEFAEKHSLEKYFGNYELLADDPQIDVIYIGTVNSEHFSQSKLAISKGKHVLCEKPMAVNTAQVKELVQLARAKRVFLMEGFWTNCFPAMKEFKKEFESRVAGEIVHLTIEIGNKFSDMDRFRIKELGGGIILNHGVYGIMLASMFLGKPDRIISNGFLNKTEGVDETAVITMTYPQGQMGTIVLSSKSKLPAELRLMGTEGTLTLKYPFWSPHTFETPKGSFFFPLPEAPPNVSFNYPSTGFIYEADEVRRCIFEGLLESPLVPLDLSIQTIEIADEARRQLGVELPQDF